MHLEWIEFKDRRKGFISRNVPATNRDIIKKIFKGFPDLNFEYFDKYSDENYKNKEDLAHFDILILPKKDKK